MRFAIPLLATAVLTGSASAAPTTPASGQAAAWQVDATRSKLGFKASMGGQAIPGSFRRWSARIRFDPKRLPVSGVVAVIDLGSATTGDTARDQALPGADWFNVKAFPQATFRTRSISASGSGYIAAGDLTIRGVTRPVTFPFTVTIAGDDARMAGTLQLDRASFGIGQGQWSSGDTIALKVQVGISITARRVIG